MPKKLYIADKERICMKTREQMNNHNASSRKYYAANKEKHYALTKSYKAKHRKPKQPRQLVLRFATIRKKVVKESKIKIVRIKLTQEEVRANERLRYHTKRRTERLLKYKNDNQIPEIRELRNKKHREMIVKRKSIDPIFKLSRQIPSLIRISIKRQGYSKNSKTFSILGCTWEELKEHIESKFEPWMNWGNWGKYNGGLKYGWDIDHIIPVSLGKSEFEIIRLNHFTNLQPLDSYVNRHIKRNKVA